MRLLYSITRIVYKPTTEATWSTRAQLYCSYCSNDRHQLHNSEPAILMSNIKRPREGGDKPKKRYRSVRTTICHARILHLTN
jgi:hypothetical protein